MPVAGSIDKDYLKKVKNQTNSLADWSFSLPLILTWWNNYYAEKKLTKIIRFLCKILSGKQCCLEWKLNKFFVFLCFPLWWLVKTGGCENSSETFPFCWWKHPDFPSGAAAGSTSSTPPQRKALLTPLLRWASGAVFEALLTCAHVKRRCLLSETLFDAGLTLNLLALQTLSGCSS